MMLRLLIVASLVLSLSACGTKSPLLTPSGDKSAKGQKDPSEPPSPITR
jgi:predicted small lipoprotein YifL